MILINKQYEQVLEFEGSDIKVNHIKFLKDIRVDFLKYISELKINEILRTNFSRMFTNI